MSTLRALTISAKGSIIAMTMLGMFGKRREESTQATEDQDRSAEDHATLANECAKVAGQLAVEVETVGEEQANRRPDAVEATESVTADESRFRRIGRGWIRR